MASETLDHADKLRELRCDVGFYKAMHERAVKREAILKQRVCELEERCARQEERISKLLEANEKLLARTAWLETQLFGRKSEQTKDRESADETPPLPAVGAAADQAPKRRGGQPGAKGHGRRRHAHLPTEEILHELPPDKQRCPRCATPFEVFPGTEDSDELDWDVRLTRRVHKRARYRPACRCGEVPGIIAAPPPPKLIPKGMFSCGFWTRLLLDKFLFQRPLYRTRSALALALAAPWLNWALTSHPTPPIAVVTMVELLGFVLVLRFLLAEVGARWFLAAPAYLSGKIAAVMAATFFPSLIGGGAALAWAAQSLVVGAPGIAILVLINWLALRYYPPGPAGGGPVAA